MSESNEPGLVGTGDEKWHGGSGTGYSYHKCRCSRCKEANTTRTARRRAERRLGREDLIHPDAPHGTPGGYSNWGCRCEDCSAEFAVALDSSYRNRLSKLTESGGRPFHPDAPHGSSNGYTSYGCRCEACTEAASARSYRSTKARSLTLSTQRVEIDGRMIHPNAPHGTNSGYKIYLCRCDTCRDWQRASRK